MPPFVWLPARLLRQAPPPLLPLTRLELHRSPLHLPPPPLPLPPPLQAPRSGLRRLSSPLPKLRGQPQPLLPPPLQPPLGG